MILSLIAAVAKNGVIGGGNTLLWDMPADMKHFRDITRGHTVLMGGKTFESIGRPLPNRRNIVITRDTTFLYEGVEVVHSIEEALQIASLEQGKEFEENQDEVEVFIIGGGEIYKQSIEKSNKLYITEIHKEFEGTTVFPTIDTSLWSETKREDFEPDENNPIAYSFVEYKKTS